MNYERKINSTFILYFPGTNLNKMNSLTIKLVHHVVECKTIS